MLERITVTAAAIAIFACGAASVYAGEKQMTDYEEISTQQAAFEAGGFALIEVSPRIFIPGGSAANREVVFSFSNPDESTVSASIYNINGRLVAQLNNSNAVRAVWDGRDNAGRQAPSGIYIYQIESEGTVYNGTVVLAR